MSDPQITGKLLRQFFSTKLGQLRQQLVLSLLEVALRLGRSGRQGYTEAPSRPQGQGTWER